MLISHIYFDDGLDITPLEDEEFRYELGEPWIYHWTLSPEQPPQLVALYNTRYIKEMSFKPEGRFNKHRNTVKSSLGTIPTRDTEEEDEEAFQDQPLIEVPAKIPLISDRHLSTNQQETTRQVIQETDEIRCQDSSSLSPIPSTETDEDRYIQAHVSPSSSLHSLETSLQTLPETEASSPQQVRLIDLCTCDPNPDPNCPICNHEHLRE